jgi:hypothetical protein
LRFGRDLLHLVPVHKAYVDIRAPHVDSATGHDGVQTILSVEFERNALLTVNFERALAAPAVTRFTHNMSFKKTAGFGAVAPLETMMSMTST